MNETGANRIYTFNARNNDIWNFVRRKFEPSPKRFYDEVNYYFEDFREYLEGKGVSYQALHNALIPCHDPKKRELLLCFDTNRNRKLCDYGQYILERVFSLLDRDSAHSILTGDYIVEEKYQERAYELLKKGLKLYRQIRWVHSEQYYFVYVNNITRNRAETMLQALKEENLYIGYGNFTFGSDLKDLLAYLLGSVCIKYKDKILFPSESEGEEERFYHFQRHGYRLIPIKPEYYFSFLDYKIETDFCDEMDKTDSLNCICPFYVDLSQVNVKVPEEKITYLRQAKARIMKRSGFELFGTEEMEDLLKQKLRQNYIFNLEFDKIHQTIKFNISFEVFCLDKRARILAAFAYEPDQNLVRLITLY